MKDLVEMEVRELLESYGYPIDLPVIKGSARLALNEDSASEMGLGSVKKLMDIVDTYIEQPVRRNNLPFLMAIEQSYVIKGRGTVVTGKVEQGVLKIDENIDLVGFNIKTTVCLGLEMFRKTLDFAETGDMLEF
jgi:elongation factor Tu